MRVPLEWLKEFVDIRQRPEAIAQALTMSGLEVEAVERVGDESIFEFAVTPNRSDWLSVAGIAREMAAATNKKFTLRFGAPQKGKGQMADYVRIAVRSGNRCPRYAARIIRGVKIGASPSWMVGRLAACGVRSVNNVVDATNYVMLELGQPLHAFDLRHVKGGRVEIKIAHGVTKFTTLDGAEPELVRGDLFICDGEGPVALAGIMGGEKSQVVETTRDILIESAFFEPTGIRRTSRRLGLISESSRRFERRVDLEGIVNALHRVVGIICDVAGGVPTADYVDIYPKRTTPVRVTLAEQEIGRILGSGLRGVGVAGLLKRLCFGVTKKGKGTFNVTVPTFRPDVTRPIDLIEEIARLYGYGRIEETKPIVRMAPYVKRRFCRQEATVRDALLGCGLSETVLYGFTSNEKLEPFSEVGASKVQVANPISKEQAAMCTTLLPGLLDAVKLNASRQRTDCCLFAIQRIYRRPMAMGSSEEPRHVAGAMTGRRAPGAWERSREMLDFYDAKGVVENLLASMGLAGQAIYQRGEAYRFLHPGSFSYVLCSGQRVGFVGQLHPDTAALWDLSQEIFVFELHFELLSEFSSVQTKRYHEISHFPFVDRDLALVVEERTPAVELERAISGCGVDLIERVNIFDVYRGDGVAPGKKSVALTLRFARADRTLTDEDVVFAVDKVVNELKTKLGAELRT